MEFNPVTLPEDLTKISSRDFQTYYQQTWILNKEKVPYHVSGFADEGVVNGVILKRSPEGKLTKHAFMEKMKHLLTWDSLSYPALGWRKNFNDPFGIVVMFYRTEETNRKGLRADGGFSEYTPECMKFNGIKNFTNQLEQVWSIFNPDFRKKSEALDLMLSGKSCGEALSSKMALLPNPSAKRPIALYVGRNKAGEYGKEVGWGFQNPKCEALYKELLE